MHESDNKKIVLIFSGGMDSTVLLYHLLSDTEPENIETLTFTYGSKHNAYENAAAKKIAANLRVNQQTISLAFINDIFKSDLLQSGGPIPLGHYQDESMRKTVVPFRNAIMLSIAAGYAESVGASKVYFGAHQGDHSIYPDTRVEFIHSFAHAMRVGTYAGIALLAPFKHSNKRDIAELGSRLLVPFEHTWTCYNPTEGMHCGKCGACTERKEALSGFDATVYADEIDPHEPKQKRSGTLYEAY